MTRASSVRARAPASSSRSPVSPARSPRLRRRSRRTSCRSTWRPASSIRRRGPAAAPCAATCARWVSAHRYREVVSVDCGRQPATWTIHADLDFRFHHVQGLLAIAEYQLAPGRPAGRLGRRGIAGRARPRRRRPAHHHHEAGPLQAAVHGRAAGVHRLRARLLEHRRGPRSSPVRYGGQPGRPMPPRCAHGRPPRPAASRSTCSSPAAARAAEACIEEWAQTARASSQKVAEGRYTTDDLVQDLARPWARMAREAAAIAAVAPAPPQSPRPPRSRSRS